MRVMGKPHRHDACPGSGELIHHGGFRRADHRDVPAACKESTREQPDVRGNAPASRLENLDDARPLRCGSRHQGGFAQAIELASCDPRVRALGHGVVAPPRTWKPPALEQKCPLGLIAEPAGDAWVL
jgi:hypothetical protein